jgi:hypothetical protein
MKQVTSNVALYSPSDRTFHHNCSMNHMSHVELPKLVVPDSLAKLGISCCTDLMKLRPAFIRGAILNEDLPTMPQKEEHQIVLQQENQYYCTVDQ